MFKLKPDNLKEELIPLQKHYKFFLGDNANDINNLKQLRDYLSDPAIKQCYNDCVKAFPDLTDVEKQLSVSMSNYKALYPAVKIPKFYSYVSGYDVDNPIKFVDSVMVIALDMYLGENYNMYSRLGLPEFRRMRFNKNYIVIDCIKQIANSRSAIDKQKTATMLDLMIQKGRILYFTETLLPGVNEEYNLAYTKKQLDWCKTNEANLWAFMINNKLLFNTDNSTLTKFMGDAPFTSAISTESPGRIGEWLGLQIVRSYMVNNKNISLPLLMSDDDFQQILNKSKYKPQNKPNLFFIHCYKLPILYLYSTYALPVPIKNENFKTRNMTFWQRNAENRTKWQINRVVRSLIGIQ